MKKAMYIYIYIYISDQTHVSANKTSQLEGFVWRFVEYNKLLYPTNLCLNENILSVCIYVYKYICGIWRNCIIYMYIDANRGLPGFIILVRFIKDIIWILDG